MLHSAPRGEPRPEERIQDRRQVRRRRDREGQSHQERNVYALRGYPADHRDDPDHHRGDPRYPDLFGGLGFSARSTPA